MPSSDQTNTLCFRSSMKSPFAVCQLIRIAAKMVISYSVEFNIKLEHNFKQANSFRLRKRIAAPTRRLRTLIMWSLAFDTSLKWLCTKLHTQLLIWRELLGAFLILDYNYSFEYQIKKLFFFSRELIPAVSVLQLFCSSPKATLRFAAVRTLNQV